MYERTYNKQVLKQHEEPEIKRFPWKRVLIACAIILLAVGFVFLMRIHALQVSEVRVEGTQVTDSEDISRFVLSDMEGMRLHFLPRTNVLLFSATSLEKKITGAFPRLATVSVGRINPHVVSVSVTEYSGMYVWCADIETTNCLFMDEKGVVFADAPYFSGSAYPKVIVGSASELPFTPISSEQLSDMKKIIERMPQVSITPTTFVFAPNNELTVYFNHQGQEATLLFNKKNPIDDSLDTLFSGMRAQQFSGPYHNPAQRLRYIDLRFPNKMVYKFE